MFAFSGSDGVLLWSTVGEGAHHRLGYSIERCEDVDGDSVSDLLARGAPYVWILSGKDGSVLLDFRWPEEPPPSRSERLEGREAEDG